MFEMLYFVLNVKQKSFQNLFRNTEYSKVKVIIDCFKIFIQRQLSALHGQITSTATR